MESAVVAHGAVAECAAYAVPDGFGGDDVMVAVVAAIRPTACAGRPVRLPRGLDARLHGARYVDVIDEIPRNTTTLRVQKFVLRERGVTPATWDRTDRTW